MAQIVMLTALAGEGIDIVCGDRCECSQEQATRFLAYGYAREMDQPGDDKRPLKRLPCAEAREVKRVATEGTDESMTSKVADPPGETTEGVAEPKVPTPKKRPAKRK